MTRVQEPMLCLDQAGECTPIEGALREHVSSRAGALASLFQHRSGDLCASVRAASDLLTDRGAREALGLEVVEVDVLAPGVEAGRRDPARRVAVLLVRAC